MEIPTFSWDFICASHHCRQLPATSSNVLQHAANIESGIALLIFIRLSQQFCRTKKSMPPKRVRRCRRAKISPGTSSSSSHPPGQSQRELFVSIFGRALCCLRASERPFCQSTNLIPAAPACVCVCSGNIGPCIQYFNTDIGNWHMREENTSKELH